MTGQSSSGHANGLGCNSNVVEKSPMFPPIPDSLYYFSPVVFQVENTIFRVPIHGFEVPGTPFETIFSLPKCDNGQPEGSCDENPIVLKVDKNSFRGFLGALYPSQRHQMTNEDWLGALELATMWMFEEIRGKAIWQLSGYVQKKSPKEAALLAKKYRVLSWLKAAYNRLLVSTDLTTNELTAHPELDWETIGRLLSVKIQVIKAYGCQYCGMNSNSQQQNFPALIDQEFGQEFKTMVPAPLGGPPLPDTEVLQPRKKKPMRSRSRLTDLDAPLWT